MYKLRQTKEARNDLDNLAAYMIYILKNGQAAQNFIRQYRKQIQNLTILPYGYRGTNLDYQFYEIRLKSFLSYNIFYVIDAKEHQIIILRVLKNR